MFNSDKDWEPDGLEEEHVTDYNNILSQLLFPKLLQMMLAVIKKMPNNLKILKHLLFIENG